MKIRSGFISNSSASSFVCVICGGVEVGEGSIADFGMFRCENKHELHLNCAGLTSLKIPKEYMDTYMKKFGPKKKHFDLEDFKEAIKETKEEAKDEYMYEVLEKYCPICQLKKMAKEDELAYYRYKLNISSEETLKEIKKTFNNYQEFKSKIYQ